jgi:hypothetical protein
MAINGDCVICFQSTIGTKRHCEECLAKKREAYHIRQIKKRCHPDHRHFFPEIFGNVEPNDKK